MISSPVCHRGRVGERDTTILLVDDDEYIRRTVRAILRRVGARIVEAGSANEALALAAQHGPSLAIVDLGLPDGDGYELVTQLRAALGRSSLGIIILTGQAPDDEALRASGADVLVLKPFRLHEFREAVLAQLSAHSAG